MQAAAVGLAAGLAGAFFLTRFLATELHGVSARDPLAFAAGATFLALVALAAAWLPARRATHVDPMEALRHE
jgi:ABC-type antimicrobial peptide transport system permease subunit